MKSSGADVQLASEWLSHLAATKAWDEVDDLVYDEPERAWRIILAMVAYAPDAATLRAVAAGPVETFYHQHGRRHSVSSRTK